MSRKVLKAIEDAGGSFEDWGSARELRGNAELPAGLVWQATDCHIISVCFYSDRPAGWRALGRDVAQGVRPCDQDDCDTCLEAAEADQLEPGDQ